MIDPSGHSACDVAGADPECNGLKINRRPSQASKSHQYPNDPENDPDYSAWRNLREGSSCAACHVVHDGYMDDGMIPNNNKLDPGLVAYYRSKDPLASVFHSLIFQQASLLGMASSSFTTSFPGIDDVEVAPGKLDYLFNSTSGKSPGVNGLGYTKGTLLDELIGMGESVKPSDFTQATQYGLKYQTSLEVTTATGVTGRVNTIWQIDHGSDVLRLITGWVQVFK